MGGVNPYIQKVSAPRAGRPFRVTFIDEETGTRREVPVDPATLAFGRIGEAGSVLDIASEAGVEINHSCGGVCACSTCHVYVTRGLKSCSASTDDEEDMLDAAPALSPESRLACQCVPNGSTDLEVVIPRWNRNQVKEGHH